MAEKPNIKTVIADNVRALLKQNGWKQRDFVKEVLHNKYDSTVTPETFNHYLVGRSGFPHDILEDIADEFGVSIDYLYGRDKNSPVKTDDKPYTIKDAANALIDISQHCYMEIDAEDRKTFKKTTKTSNYVGLTDYSEKDHRRIEKINNERSGCISLKIYDEKLYYLGTEWRGILDMLSKSDNDVSLETKQNVYDSWLRDQYRKINEATDDEILPFVDLERRKELEEIHTLEQMTVEEEAIELPFN